MTSRLFHAIVLVGAAMGCSSTSDPVPTADAGSDATSDASAETAADTAADTSEPGFDVTPLDSMRDIMPEATDGFAKIF